MMTESRLIANPRHAVRADCIQITFVQRKIGAAMLAAHAAFSPRRAAGRAAHDGRLMPLRFLDGEHATALATKAAP